MTDVEALATAQLDKAMFTQRVERAQAEALEATGWFIILARQGASDLVMAKEREKIMALMERQLDLIVEGVALDQRIGRAR